MTTNKSDKSKPENSLMDTYVLGDQIGHILRRAFQRHTNIFGDQMPKGLTATRFAALEMLREKGSLSQNELGRLTAMDIATINGVVRWLSKQGYVEVGPYPNDARRNLIALTEQGEEILKGAVPAGIRISELTLKPLTRSEARKLMELLRKIG